MKIKVKERKTYQCKKCNAQFMNRQHLCRHRHENPECSLKPNQPAKVYSCSSCTKSFGRKDSLNRLIKTCSGLIKKTICNICNEDFVTAWRLKRHTASKRTNKNCENCKRSYSKEKCFKNHFRNCNGPSQNQSDADNQFDEFDMYEYEDIDEEVCTAYFDCFVLTLKIRGRVSGRDILDVGTIFRCEDVRIYFSIKIS